MAKEIALSVKTDRQSIRQAQRELKTVDNSLAEIGKQAQSSGQSVSSIGRVTRDTSRDSVAGLRAQRDAQESLNREIAETLRKQRQQALGATGTGLTKLRGAAGAFGLGGAAGPLGQLAGLSDIGRTLQPAIDGLRQLGQQASQSSPLLQRLGGSMGEAGQGASMSIRQFAALGAAGVAAGIAIGALGLAVDKFRRDAERQAKEFQSIFDAQADVGRQIAQGLTTDEAQARVAELERLIASEQDMLGRANQAYDDFFEGVVDIFSGAGPLDDALGRIAFGVAQTFDEREQSIADSISRTEDRLNSYQSELNALNRAIENNALTANDAAKEQERITEENTAREAELTAERQRATQTIAQLAEQERRLREDFARRALEITEDRTLRETRELEDWLDTVNKHLDRLNQIRTEGNARIEQLEQDFNDGRIKSEQEVRDRIADVVKRTRDRISDLETEFQRESQRRAQRFTRDQLRAQADLNQRIFDAQISNDIISIRQAQRAADRREKERQEDFDTESREREEARRERVAALKRETDDTIAEIRRQAQAEIQERAALLQVRIEQEREAIQQRLEAERDSQQEQERLRQRRMRRQEQDEQIADRRRQEAHQRQLSEIAQRRNAEVAALRIVEAAMLQLVNNVRNAASVPIRQQQQTPTEGIRGLLQDLKTGGGTSSQPTIGGMRSITRFAEGGIVPRNQRVIGEFEGARPYDEAVIPLTARHLERLAPALQGKGGPTFNFGTITVGDGVNEAQVRRAVVDGVGAAISGLHDARMGSG